MNSVTLVGRLTGDPDLRTTRSNREVWNLRIAVDGHGENDTTYVDVVTFDKGAVACATYLEKGRQVAVQGRLSYREWETGVGEKRSKHKVIGQVEFLGSKPSDAGAEAAIEEITTARARAERGRFAPSAADDDIPFSFPSPARPPAAGENERIGASCADAALPMAPVSPWSSLAWEPPPDPGTVACEHALQTRLFRRFLGTTVAGDRRDGGGGWR